MRDNTQLKVFYDSQCAICGRKIADYRKLNDALKNRADSVIWLDIYQNRAALNDAGISFNAAKTSLQVVDIHGSIYDGVKAHLQLWGQLDGYRKLATLIERTPGLYTLCCLYYQGFLAYRRIINRRLSLITQG